MFKFPDTKTAIEAVGIIIGLMYQDIPLTESDDYAKEIITEWLWKDRIFTPIIRDMRLFYFNSDEDMAKSIHKMINGDIKALSLS